jgi:hypothetical protein
VHDRKIALGLMGRETCVAQSYAWGAESQVDRHEAYADFDGERVKRQVFAMRRMAQRSDVPLGRICARRSRRFWKRLRKCLRAARDFEVRYNNAPEPARYDADDAA